MTFHAWMRRRVGCAWVQLSLCNKNSCDLSCLQYRRVKTKNSNTTNDSFICLFNEVFCRIKKRIVDWNLAYTKFFTMFEHMVLAAVAVWCICLEWNYLTPCMENIVEHLKKQFLLSQIYCQMYWNRKEPWGILK